MAYIKKKKNGSFLITVSCGRDSQDKKITRSTTYRPDPLTSKGHPKTESTILKEVNTYAASFEKKVLSGEYTEGAAMTFEEYSVKYLEEYAVHTQAPGTLENTRAAIKIFTEDFGFMALENLTPLFLQEYANKLKHQKKASGDGTLSYVTVKRRLAVLSSMLSQAVRWNLIRQNPMERVTFRKDSSDIDDKTRYFTQEQAEIFLDVLENPLKYSYNSRQRRDSSGKTYQIQEYQAERDIHLQLKFFFHLSMFTGCRRGELIALHWSDIDFDNKTIHINKNVCRVKGRTITKTAKTKKSVRTVTVPDIVIDFARQWKAAQARYRLSIGSQWRGEDFVFIRSDGSQMGLETPNRAFHRIIKNYNENRPDEAPELPMITLHGLRHTAATLLIGQGVNVKTVSNRLGHASTSTTMNIYAHALQELDRSASDTLENLLLKGKTS